MSEVAEYQYQLEQIQGALNDDPDNEELLTLQQELQDLIALTQTKQQQQSTKEEDKRKLAQDQQRKVGDSVLAKWVTGDHQFYPAKITSITGPPSNHIYVVKFIEYNETQTLHGHQLKNISEQKKRALEVKKDKIVATLPQQTVKLPPPPPPEPLKKRAKVTHELTKSQNSWTAFAKQGPKTKATVGKRKAIGESSMFRTSDDGRVGVIGSGKGMTSDGRTRGKHVW